VKSLKIIYPPQILQNKFTDIVKRHNRIIEEMIESERQAEHLFQTLLQRAFAGEL
jgi:type I restriction enzyme S subunit